MQSNWKKQFAILYAGQMFSLLGSAAVQFAFVWWLTVQTESAVTLSVASIVAFLPNIIIGPFAGVWIDRYNRRTVMIAADGLVALSSVVLGAAFLMRDMPPIWFVYVVLFLRGLGNTFHSPALQATIPMLVPAEMLTKAGGWGSLISSVIAMAGPVLGAALMGVAPMAGIVLVDIAGAAFAIGCLLFVKIADVPRSGENVNLLTDMKQGLAAIAANKPLVAVMGPVMLVNMLYMPLGTLFPLLMRAHYMGGAWHNGIVEVLFAGGLMLSSLIIGTWGGMRKRFLMASLAIGVLGVSCVVSGALPPGGFWVFVGCSFVMGCTGTFINVPLISYIQQSVPAAVMGKVLSLLMTVSALAMPVGLLVAGPVSEVVGVDSWFFWSGIALAGTAVLCRVLTRPYDQQTLRPDTKAGQQA